MLILRGLIIGWCFFMHSFKYLLSNKYKQGKQNTILRIKEFIILWDKKGNTYIKEVSIYPMKHSLYFSPTVKTWPESSSSATGSGCQPTWSLLWLIQQSRQGPVKAHFTWPGPSFPHAPANICHAKRGTFISLCSWVKN